MINAALFDMDGLLIDSMPLWRQAVKEAVEAAGSSFSEEMWDQSKGGRVDEIIAYWHELRPWKKKSVQTVGGDVMNRALELIKGKGGPMDGSEHILRFARERKVKTALASSSPKKIMDAVVEKLGFGKYFDLVVSAQEVEHGKPHPAIYVHTAQRLRVPVHSCLVFEDSLPGLIAAKAASMKCVAVPSRDYRYDPRMILADKILGSLGDFTLTDWLEIEELTGGTP